MKLLTLLLFTLSAHATPTDAIIWGFSGVNRAKEWVSPDGRMSQQNTLNSNSTAIDLWPTTGTLPTLDSLAEITLYRTRWSDTQMERMNISAMASGGEYRFGVERANGGSFRNMIFCFENVTPGVAVCNFKITPTGVFVSDDGGTTWRAL